MSTKSIHTIMSSTPAPETSNMTPDASKTKKSPRPKSTFMLHAPPPPGGGNTIGTNIGKFVSTDHRYAALKCASRKHTAIHLRKTNSKLVYEFQGGIQALETPHTVRRGDQEFVCKNRPFVKFIRTYVANTIPDDESVESDTPAK